MRTFPLNRMVISVYIGYQDLRPVQRQGFHGSLRDIRRQGDCVIGHGVSHFVQICFVFKHTPTNGHRRQSTEERIYRPDGKVKHISWT